MRLFKAEYLVILALVGAFLGAAQFWAGLITLAVLVVVGEVILRLIGDKPDDEGRIP